jgi:hypothetical protein
MFFSKKALAFLKNPDHHISLYWTPSHCGIDSNERVDELAKKATQPNRTAVFDTPTIAFHKAHSKKLMAKQWETIWRESRDKLHLFRPAATHPPSLRPSPLFHVLADKKEIFGRMTQALTEHGYIGKYYQ